VPPNVARHRKIVDDIAERRGLDDQDSFHPGGSGRQARKAVRMPRISR
jgi:hypothetical protein